MELKLTVRNESGEFKTYTTDTIDLEFGLIEDILNVVDVDKFDNDLEIAKMVLKAIKFLKPMLKQIFKGITDDEIRTASVKQIINLFVQILSFSTTELMDISSNGKN